MATSFIHMPPTSPKSVRYQTNGTGRDTYIYYNNGGNAKDGFAFNNKIQDTSLGTINQNQLVKLATSVPVAGKSVHYISDGSGRDSYIKFNDGGFSINPSKKLNFLSSLRNYERPIEPREEDYFVRVQNQKSPREIKQLTLLSKLQQIQIEKLSSPKHQKQKFVKQDSRLPSIAQRIAITDNSPNEKKIINRNYSLPALQLKNKYNNNEVIEINQ